MKKQTIYGKVTKLLSYCSGVASGAAALLAVISAVTFALWIAYSADYQWSVPMWIVNLLWMVQKGTYFDTLLFLGYKIILFVLNSVLFCHFYAYFKSESNAGTPFTADGAKAIRKMGLRMILLTVLSSLCMSLTGSYVLQTDRIMLISGVWTFVPGVFFVLISFVVAYGAKNLECADD